jgi:indole-3-glycerol phosphate synthase
VQRTRAGDDVYRTTAFQALIVSTILDQIVATKRQEIARAKQQVTEAELRNALTGAPPVRSFFAALAGGPPIRLIAEVKKASPSKGVIRADFDPVAIARTYEQAGASCISVLTDESYFQGSLDYLRQIRQAVDIPLLRKDFILDWYQLLEARAAGADAVLLIAECLDDCQLRSLHNQALDLGLTPLVELYEPDNLPRVLQAGATLIGVNNRDLRTFQVDLEHTIRLRPAVPDDCLLVGESGIHRRQDVLRLEQAGVDAMLVGESLMKQADIAAAVRTLLGTDA